MNKHTAIIIVASVVIVTTVGYSVFSAMTLDQLQLTWHQSGSFDYLTMLNGGQLKVCNPSFIPLQFHGLTIRTVYDGSEVGRFYTSGAIIEPDSAVKLAGTGESTGLTGQMISMYLDTEISGTDIMRVNSDAMQVVTSIDTALIGVIPYSVSDVYTGKEFFTMMNGYSGNYDC